jgi:hypothetical protein
MNAALLKFSQGSGEKVITLNHGVRTVGDIETTLEGTSAKDDGVPRDRGYRRGSEFARSKKTERSSGMRESMSGVEDGDREARIFSEELPCDAQTGESGSADSYAGYPHVSHDERS